MNDCNHNKNHGPDSYWMHDPKLLFDSLNLKEGDVFADIGCGMGSYSLTAAELVGPGGMVYAVDQLEECVIRLNHKARSYGLTQIEALSSDITARFPIESETCDVCFICTVLHSLNLQQYAENIFGEVLRVLKPEGRLFIVECKKQDTTFGPPLYRRMSPEELTKLVCAFNFRQAEITDLGYNYMVEYTRI